MKRRYFINKSLKTLVFSAFMLITINKTKAQFNIGGPGTSGSGVYANGAADAPVVPFDGGMSLMLAAAGIGYTSKKVKNFRIL